MMCSKTLACPRPTGHVVAVVAAAVAVTFLHPVFAYDEKTPVHFVAKDGIDQGDCSTPQEPCATIDYALENAATGDELRVAAGVYSLRPHAPAEIADLLSSEVTVRGGFSVEDMFQSLDDVNPTVLVTPDSRYADRLQMNGFVVRSEAQLSQGAPRHVSEDGSDSGNCDNMNRPCASITYALTQAQPGSAVLIASGTYFVPETAVDDLLRDDIMVRGGFSQTEGFVWDETAPSYVYGPSHRRRKALARRGLTLIQDQKGIAIEQAIAARRPAAARPLGLPRATPCDQDSGMAGPYPCSNVDWVWLF